MTTTPRWVPIGFTIAGLFNLAIIGVTRGFSNNLGAVDPLFAPAGCGLICIWGLAYISVAKQVQLAPHIAAVFCIEKLFYVANWAHSLMTFNGELQNHSADVRLFFQSYGLGDLGFAIMFGLTWWRFRRAAP